MTPRERFFSALNCGRPDRIPFVVWDNKLPDASHGDTALRDRLLELETCVTVKTKAYDTVYDGIEISREKYTGEDGESRRKTTYHTSSGDLTEIGHPQGETTWKEKLLFSTPDDYDALEELISSQVYTGRFDSFEDDQNKYGESSVARPGTIKTAMQELMYTYMGVEAFCIEWMENRERVSRLLETMREDRLKKVEMIAASPAAFAVIEANIAPEIVGYERFRDLYIPEIEAACEILHRSGKLAGAHLDSNNRLLAPLVAETSLDFIESFTPPPECDLSLAEARKAWPGKAIIANFPSSIHLQGAAKVREAGVSFIKECEPGNGFALGILENLPVFGMDTMATLAETVLQEGRNQ